MNCVELQQSLVEIEDGTRTDQRLHLKTCPECSALLAELNLIAATATDLRGAEEPSPRVWNSIEIALRQEGLIRPQSGVSRGSRSLLPSFGSRWTWARWVVPAAAVLLITVGVYLRQHSASQQIATNVITPVKPPTGTDPAGLSDDDLLQEIAQQSPAMQAQYADNLRRVNEYIHDAKSDADSNPNDEEARRSLMEAYQEKAMLFELAMDHPLQ